MNNKLAHPGRFASAKRLPLASLRHFAPAKRRLVILLAAALFCGCQHDVTRYVNPFVGTAEHGHTYPGAIVPFGQIQPGPDTRLSGWDGCSAYHYSDDTIYGFSHTHLSGTGCEDYGDILLMPVTTDDVDWTFTTAMPQQEFCSHFQHRSEKAVPGYYRVVLDRNHVMVELSATDRVACHRYTFPGHSKKGFVIDLCHRDKVISAGFNRREGRSVITGWRESSAWNPHQKCFFALECSEPIKEVKYFDNGRKALVTVDQNCRDFEVYVAISGVDCAGAARNLATREARTFVDIRDAAHAAWAASLGRIEVEGGSRRDKENFYTALYHCYTSPYLWSDVDGRYRGMDDSIRTIQPDAHGTAHPMYTVFSLWDTYRALHPLMAILEPRITEDWISTMLRQYEAGGELTMWELAGHETHCMIGYHACPVILEAYNRGVLKDWSSASLRELLQAMVATSDRTEAHQSCALQGYMDSQTDNESVSKTLEYAYDDWCIAQFAQAVGSDSVYRAYMRRCQSWQNIMDGDGFMHARRNGGFVTPFDPAEVNNHYTEANSWQYSSYVPHDIPRWVQLMGGREKALAWLDQLFSTSSETTGRDQSDITGMIGQYAHGNEPSHHAAYLYNYLGAPEKADEMVHRILRKLYSPASDGLCGNEDCGQMSAWFVMSAMGFYPVCPGSGEYATVTPLFDKVTIHPAAGDDIVIAKSEWPAGKFWRAGEFCDTSVSGIPDELRATPAPLFGGWEQSFQDSVAVTLRLPGRVPDPAARIYYTLYGGRPDTNATLYTGPIKVKNDMTIQAVAYSPATGYSPVVRQQLTRFIADKKLRYITKPAPQYSENGPVGLIDRLYGTTNYRIGGYQGWQGDMEVVVDLLDQRVLTSVGVSCFENMRSWIFFPSKVEVSVSADGKSYRPWASVENTLYPAVRERQEENVRQTLVCAGGYTTARFVKVKAVNYGAMPDWHISAGEQAWLFADEVEVRSYPLGVIYSTAPAEAGSEGMNGGRGAEGGNQ